MNDNNPAEMSNQDLEKDMDNSNMGARNQEKVSKSTAAEGVLKTTSTGNSSSAVGHHTAGSTGNEQDLDDLIHRQAEEETHNGNLPNPEDIPAWEDDDDLNKISS